MNISSAQGSDAVLQAMQTAGTMENKRAQLQLMLLKKSLDDQQQQSAEIMNQLQGKGQQIDIRV